MCACGDPCFTPEFCLNVAGYFYMFHDFYDLYAYDMQIKFQMWATVFIQHVEENPYLKAVK